MIDVRVRPPQSPNTGILREVPLHVFVNTLLQIDPDRAIGTDHDIGAANGIRRRNHTRGREGEIEEKFGGNLLYDSGGTTFESGGRIRGREGITLDCSLTAVRRRRDMNDVTMYCSSVQCIHYAVFFMTI